MTTSSYADDRPPYAAARTPAQGHTGTQRSILRLIEYVYVIVVLAMCLNGLREVFSTSADSGIQALTDANPMFQLFSGTLYLVAALFILTDFRRFITLCRGNWPLLLLVGFIVLSAGWSSFPLVSMRRAAALLLTTGFAAYLAMRFPPETVLRLVAWACCLTGIASIVLAVIDPTTAIHSLGDPNGGDWRGIFGHKNNMGRSMTYGVLTLGAAIFLARPPAKPAAMAGFFLCVVLLFLSGSRTGWVVTLFLLLGIPLFLLLQPSRFSPAVRMTMSGVGIAIALVLVAVTYKYGLAAIGRDETLSGRTHLWEVAIGSGMKHFALGAGYRAFWNADAAADVYQQVMWGASIGNGHNGYLDTWLELGGVGFSLFLLVVAVTGFRIARRLIRSPDITSLWLAITLSYMMIYALTEQVLMQQSEITWVMLVATLFWFTPSRYVQPRPQGVIDEPETAASAAGNTPRRGLPVRYSATR